jgi:hypothetical protein
MSFFVFNINMQTKKIKCLGVIKKNCRIFIVKQTMGVFRIYPSKSNTIASGAYVSYNSGQNAVTDLWYGGGGGDTALEKRNSISRFIVKFDLEELTEKMSAMEINPNLVSSFRLRMKNAIPGDRILEPEYEFDVLEKRVAASFDLIAFPINKDWDEGRGYDLYKENYLVRQYGNPLLTGYSNWNFATLMTTWDEPGVYTNPTASTAVTYYSTQHFDIGNEDINMDITDIVRDWLSGGSENYGIGVAYRRDYELLSTDTRYISSFFTENTNTAFKPFIEVVYNQSFQDDRLQVSNNRNSRLFLYTFSGNNAVNYYSAGTVDIQTLGGAPVITGLTPTQLENGVYYIDILMSAATRGEQYKDVWRGITFVPGIDQQDITQIFTIRDNYYLNNVPDVNDYSISVYGIGDNSILTIGENHKVFVDLRVNYSSRNQPKTAYDIKYRIVMNNQDEVVPWTSINQAVINKCKTNYFVLETGWLLHNQSYKIEYRVDEFGTKRVLPNSTIFRVIRPEGF